MGSHPAESRDPSHFLSMLATSWAESGGAEEGEMPLKSPQKYVVLEPNMMYQFYTKPVMITRKAEV